MAPKKKVPVVPLFSKLEQEYAKALLPKLLAIKDPKLTIKHVGGVPKYEIGPTTSTQADKMYDEWEGSFEQISPSNKLILDADKEIENVIRHQRLDAPYADLNTFTKQLKPKLEGLRSKEGHKHEYTILPTTITSSSGYSAKKSSLNKYVNYLVDKNVEKLPTQIADDPSKLLDQLDQVIRIRNKSNNDFRDIMAVSYTIPDSNYKLIPNASEMLKVFDAKLNFKGKIPNAKEIDEMVIHPAWSGRGRYGWDVLNDEVVNALGNYKQASNLATQINDKLKNTSPAKLVEGQWFGKLTKAQQRAMDEQNFAYHLNQVKGKEFLDKVPDSVIEKNIDKVPISIKRKRHHLGSAKEWLYEFKFKYRDKDNFLRESSEFFKSPILPGEVKTSVDKKQGIIQLASRIGLEKASQDIIGNYVRGQIYQKGLPEVGKLLESKNPQFMKNIKEVVGKNLPSMQKQMEYELDIKNNPLIVEGITDIMKTSYPSTQSPQLFNRGHKFAQKRLADMIKVMPEGEGRDAATALMNMSGDTNMIQFQPSIVNKPITTAVEKLLQNPTNNLTPDEKGKIQKLLSKLKTTSMFVNMKGQIIPYGINKGDPYAINRLTEKEFMELIEILSKNNYRKIAEHVRREEFDKFNRGGAVDYGEMKDVVPPLDPGERQHLVKGGSKKGKPTDIFSTLSQYQARAQLPEVIGHTTKITEKLAAPKGDVVVKPWAVVDRDGLPIKDFKTEKDAEKWLYDKKETVPENEYYESTIDYSVKPVEQIKATADKDGVWTVPAGDETPAMMWKAPEVIANAPMETAQGKQWLGILKKAGVSPKELDDTSLAPFLEIHEPNTKFTKAQLLKEFDDLAPKIEVLTTGKRDQGKYLTNILKKFNNVCDSISDFSGKDQAVLNSFTGILQKVNAAKTDKELSVLANQTNKIMKQGYGINNALMSDQIPTIRQIPAPIRSIFGDMQELFKTRGAAHAFNKKPSHAGDQVLPGGVNYREYMFKYTPNQFRGDEPRYTPGHTFSFSDDVAQNTFVHARISDRTDNFGRKLLFVEEIQSDMHQRPQKRIREGESSGYATRQDKIVGAEPLIQELKVLQNKIDAILAREPNNSSLPALYKKRGTLADKIEKIRLEASAKGKGGDIPEGPFQRSEDYGSFVMKYLLRLAKEGNYDGVAVSTGSIKNRKGYGSEEQTKGHYGFYDKIMQKVLKKIAKNADLEYNRTVINDGAVNWGNVPILILKEVDKVMKGLPSFREGGLNRENFVDVVPLL